MATVMEKYDFKLILGVLVILLLAQLLDGCALEQEEEALVRDDILAPAPETAGEPAAVPTISDEEATGTSGRLCCIDYRCPGTDIAIAGCKTGGSSPGAAYRECEDACDVSCTSSGLYCD